jgi:nucleoside-diphosphate-sugar epimerase
MHDMTGSTVEPVYAELRSGDVRDSQADIAKARRILGYEPSVSFEEGLQRTLDWYRATVAAAVR